MARKRPLADALIEGTGGGALTLTGDDMADLFGAMRTGRTHVRPWLEQLGDCWQGVFMTLLLAREFLHLLSVSPIEAPCWNS